MSICALCSRCLKRLKSQSTYRYMYLVVVESLFDVYKSFVNGASTTKKFDMILSTLATRTLIFHVYFIFHFNSTSTLINNRLINLIQGSVQFR
jgi:hypothetical protein